MICASVVMGEANVKYFLFKEPLCQSKTCSANEIPEPIGLVNDNSCMKPPPLLMKLLEKRDDGISFDFTVEDTRKELLKKPTKSYYLDNWKWKEKDGQRLGIFLWLRRALGDAIVEALGAGFEYKIKEMHLGVIVVGKVGEVKDEEKKFEIDNTGDHVVTFIPKQSAWKDMVPNDDLFGREFPKACIGRTKKQCKNGTECSFESKQCSRLAFAEWLRPPGVLAKEVEDLDKLNQITDFGEEYGEGKFYEYQKDYWNARFNKTPNNGACLVLKVYFHDFSEHVDQTGYVDLTPLFQRRLGKATPVVQVLKASIDTSVGHGFVHGGQDFDAEKFKTQLEHYKGLLQDKENSFFEVSAYCAGSDHPTSTMKNCTSKESSAAANDATSKESSAAANDATSKEKKILQEIEKKILQEIGRSCTENTTDVPEDSGLCCDSDDKELRRGKQKMSSRMCKT
eukprot:g3207.t1